VGRNELREHFRCVCEDDELGNKYISGVRENRVKQDGYQLVAGFLELEVWSSGREFVDQLVDGVAEAGMLVPLEIRFQVIFGKSFVDLEGFSIPR